MIGRDLNKRIDLYSVTRASDGFGGYVVEDALLSTSWAKVETLNPGELKYQYGIESAERVLRITVRKRNDLDYTNTIQFIKYRDKKYTISTPPVNSDFEDRFITFLVNENTSSNQVVLFFTAPTIPVTDFGD